MILTTLSQILRASRKINEANYAVIQCIRCCSHCHLHFEDEELSLLKGGIKSLFLVNLGKCISNKSGKDERF